MPTTLRNTDILFNDGTAQGTTFFRPPAPGATLITCDQVIFAPGDSTTTYLLSDKGYLFPVAGVIRTRMRVVPAQSAYTVVTGFARIFKNGVATGTERSSSGLTLIFEEDITVAAGDVLQLGSRAQFAGNAATQQFFIKGDFRQQCPTILMTAPF
jgi:hypothetical protein